MTEKEKIEYIKSRIGSYPDFPKKGIIFRDIFSALTDGKVCQYLKEIVVDYIKRCHPEVELIVGLESRGFLFNMMIAAELGIGCAPVRKKGKLPGELVSVEYTLEYGTDVFEMQTTAIQKCQKVLIIDDLLATGGSLDAAIQLVQKAGGEVVACVVILELVDLNGRKKLNTDVHSFIEYCGD
ncbi:adenine phosphoribosyltransferase-like [Teleopsis dalmanni]|uniref:adenine phosphoribosyltransferase n=1 Tax=Teleopsis dalmanni TaxID=139649 RepID=UPI0018CD8136|nr:adenine phosphoribosyltransferase [Teleopsis dalmanni]XP_037934092.1 adenine phosphoribosyltransferase-like [Teleopsis dalmanni]